MQVIYLHVQDDYAYMQYNYVYSHIFFSRMAIFHAIEKNYVVGCVRGYRNS